MRRATETHDWAGSGSHTDFLGWRLDAKLFLDALAHTYLARLPDRPVPGPAPGCDQDCSIASGCLANRAEGKSTVGSVQARPACPLSGPGQTVPFLSWVAFTLQMFRLLVASAGLWLERG